MVRKSRKGRKKKVKARALKLKRKTPPPHLRGTVLRTWVDNPRKPNSADRKLARVRLTNGKEVTCAIPGERHHVKEHSQVLVRPGGYKDIVGCKYEIIRGALDTNPVEDRRTARSRFGTKRN